MIGNAVQLVIVILVVVLSLAMLGRMAMRTFFPKGKSCGGDCCCGDKEASPAASQNAPAAKPERIMMVRSVDLSRRAAEIKRAGS